MEPVSPRARCPRRRGTHSERRRGHGLLSGEALEGDAAATPPEPRAAITCRVRRAPDDGRATRASAPGRGPRPWTTAGSTEPSSATAARVAQIGRAPWAPRRAGRRAGSAPAEARRLEEPGGAPVRAACLGPRPSGTRGLDEHHAARTRRLGGRGARERRGRGQGPVSMQRPSVRQAHTGRTGPRAAHHHAHERRRLSLTGTLVGDGVERVCGRRRGGRRTSAMAVRARHLHCAAPPGTSTLGAGPSTAWLSATSARRRVTRSSDGSPRRSRVLGVGHYPCALATGQAPRARTTGQMDILIECPDPWRDNAAIHTPSTLASPGGRSRGRKSRSSP